LTFDLLADLHSAYGITGAVTNKRKARKFLPWPQARQADPHPTHLGKKNANLGRMPALQIGPRRTEAFIVTILNVKRTFCIVFILSGGDDFVLI
jgi:hypothetical protein